MTLPVAWTRAAEADLQQALGWYAKISEELADRFLSSVERTVREIGERPLGFAVIHRGRRRAGIRRFPYGLIFEAHDDAAIVLACFHGRRDPQRWQSR